MPIIEIIQRTPKIIHHHGISANASINGAEVNKHHVVKQNNAWRVDEAQGKGSATS